MPVDTFQTKSSKVIRSKVRTKMSAPSDDSSFSLIALLLDYPLVAFLVTYLFAHFVLKWRDKKKVDQFERLFVGDRSNVGFYNLNS